MTGSFRNSCDVLPFDHSKNPTVLVNIFLPETFGADVVVAEIDVVVDVVVVDVVVEDEVVVVAPIVVPDAASMSPIPTTRSPVLLGGLGLGGGRHENAD